MGWLQDFTVERKLKTTAALCSMIGVTASTRTNSFAATTRRRQFFVKKLGSAAQAKP